MIFFFDNNLKSQLPSFIKRAPPIMKSVHCTSFHDRLPVSTATSESTSPIITVHFLVDENNISSGGKLEREAAPPSTDSDTQRN